jgi:histidine ammonia-lyase
MLLPQTTAAALVSENKSLSFPATVDSIPTCEDQEDHVAMSTTAARRAAEVVANTRRIVAIELLGASDALLFREKDASVRLGAGASCVLPQLRQLRPSCRTPSEAIEAISERIQDGSILQGLPELEGVR